MFTSCQRCALLLSLIFVMGQPVCLSAALSTVPVMQTPLQLSPSAAQLAQSLGMTENIDQLSSAHRAGDTSDAATIRQLLVKQDITQTVLIAMLQVRGANAQIAADLAESVQIRGALESKRDKGMQANSIANFSTQAITEVVGGALQLVPRVRYDNAGNIVEIAGGGLQSVLSIMALRQARGDSYKGSLQPNMLAAIFKLNADEDSKYPPVIWNYLNAIRPGATGTRIDELMSSWVRLGRLKKVPRPGHLVALTGSGNKHEPLTIATLQERELLLSDLSAAISQIDRDLVEIMLYVHMAQ